MTARGWTQLVDGAPWLVPGDSYSIRAYSEYMPPPRLGCKPLGMLDEELFSASDPWGWHVGEYDEAFELRPGLQQVAQQLVKALGHLGRREPAHGISRRKLQDNPFYPEALQEAGAPPQERYVVLAPLALARTQDDKGRVRWTLFGGSEQGPAKPFWRSFWRTPREERPPAEALSFFCGLLSEVYSDHSTERGDLRRTGLRVFTAPAPTIFPYWDPGVLPTWAESLRWAKGQSLRGVKYLLTFEPFAALPRSVQSAYRAGDLHLLPFPGSLLFWGVRDYLTLQHELPLAVQIPLLHSIERHEAPWGLRVPQSGWMHEPRAGAPPLDPSHGPVRNDFQRTHRWARVHRHENELEVLPHEDKVAHVLFSTAADDLGLYGKPMARNAQIWDQQFQLVLDGPRAVRQQLVSAAAQVEHGGLFGYRFMYPPMQVGRHMVFWQRPLTAYRTTTGEAKLLSDAPLGYLTAYRIDRPRLDKPVELWPRLLNRPSHRAAIELFRYDCDPHYHQTTLNIRKLLDAWQLFNGAPLDRGFARQLLTLPRRVSLDAWLTDLPGRTVDTANGQRLAEDLRQCLATEPADTDTDAAEASLTYAHTARRSFELEYWKNIHYLAHGKYVNKDNADCVKDSPTRAKLKHHSRDLELLGDYLLAWYDRTIRAAGMAGRALAGELPFRWQTDFDFTWSEGWERNQQGAGYERDLVVVIPGRDRRRAVIMADHYDTAYMEDLFGYTHGGHGPRLSAAGADDNHSATAALMLGSKVFLELSKAGLLACDVWLVHLTGEEFPADCLGPRYLCERLVERSLRIRRADGKRRSLARTRVQGVYVLDMVAHNNDHHRDIFQICPGGSRASLWLAWQAHRANRIWNSAVPRWNHSAKRKLRQRGQRSADGATVPPVAPHLALSGEVRPQSDPRSTLYNTDGQIFSDAGVPVVLFMENYDINRQGYHDTHDTMENIDLDYGAALAAIAIETVARAASESPPWGRVC